MWFATMSLVVTVLLLLALPVPAHASIVYIGLTNGQVIPIDAATGRRGEPLNARGQMVLSPDNRTLYFVEAGFVRRVDTATKMPGAAIRAAGLMAISPDGATLLVTGGGVTPIDTATGRAGSPIGVSARDLAIASDGRTAYALTMDNTITPIDLATNTPQTPIALAHPGSALAITPDATLAVVTENEGRAGFVQVVDLANGTAEAPVAVTQRVPVGEVAVAPDGGTAYVTSGTDWTDGPISWPTIAGTVYPFTIASRTVGAALMQGYAFPVSRLAVNADGARVIGVAPCDAWCGYGQVFDHSATDPGLGEIMFRGTAGPPVASPTDLVLAPSPAALFSASPAWAMDATTFDAVGSNNDGGSIVKYTWDFGDGSASTTNSARASHIYANPGTYTVKLTTTNAGGCASRVVYTGKSATCSGLTTATTARTVTIITPGATVATAKANGLTTTAATLSGTVGYTVGQVDWHFEYGPTTGYGQTTAVTRGTGQARATVTGLKPNTTYHYRLVAATDKGTPPVSYGTDMTFKTAATGTLRLQTKTLRLRGRSVTVALRCQSSVGCRGALKLTAGKRTCATGTYRLKANQRAHKRLTLRSVCRSKRSARLTSTSSTGQKTFAATVRVKR